MAVDIKVIEGVPNPDRLPVLVQFHQRIAKYRGCSGVAGEVSEIFRVVYDYYDISVRKEQEIVVHGLRNQVKACRSQASVQLCSRHRSDNIPRKINLLENSWSSCGRWARWSRVDQKMTVGKQLDRERQSPRRSIRINVVVPDHIPLQICDYRF